MRRLCFLTSLPAVGLLTSGVASSQGRASANLLRNGGFEQPVVPDGSYQLFSSGQSFPGWKVVGASGNVAPISGKFSNYGFVFPASSGPQWLDLTGVSNSHTGISQTVRTTAGARYTLRFSVGNIDDPSGHYGRASSVLVFVNGKRLMTARNDLGAGQTSQVWRNFATTIRATSTATTLAFRNGDPASDNENGLDSVLLVRR